MRNLRHRFCYRDIRLSKLSASEQFGYRNRFMSSLIIASLILISLSILPNYTEAAIWSSSEIVYSESNIRYVDGDLSIGKNYIYSFADQYNSYSSVTVKRSVDGSTWSSPTTILSNLDYPHGGFCVYSDGNTDNLICSAFENVKKSTDNGATFSSLTPLPNALDYTGVATNASMDLTKPVDDDIYIAGNLVRQNNGIFLFKSVDGGVSWSQIYRITEDVGYDTEACMPVLMRIDAKLYCIYAEGAYWSQGIPRDVYVRNSTDWGKTWGNAMKIYTYTLNEVGAYPGKAQYLDENRCLLTITEHCYINSNSRGVYGYLWYSNNTFQMVGYETGMDYSNPCPHTYIGMVSNDPNGVNYTSFWCSEVDDLNWIMKTHFSYDSGIAVPDAGNLPITPIPTDNSIIDSDLDALDDNKELSIGTDPNNWDTDGDLLSDGFEILTSLTDPMNNDTDGDGIDDFTDFVQTSGYYGLFQTLPNGWIGMTITWQNQTIVIKTNSSILDGKFDKDRAILTIRIQGPPRTTGAAMIIVPKTMCDLSDIRIRFDGRTINFDVLDDGANYNINITYHHSEHMLSVQLQDVSATTSLSSMDYLIILAVAMTIIGLIGVAIVIRNRRKLEPD